MAAISKTAIANLALSHIRHEHVLTDLDTDTSQEGVTTRLWYDPARRQTLVDANPGFARKRLTLAAHGEDPSADWAYRYQYPSDCIHPRFIVNPSGRNKTVIPFDIEQADDNTMSILTDEEDAVLAYTKDVIDTTFFTPHVVLALSYLLAHYIAGPITGKASIRKDMMESYNLAVNVALAHEANVTSIGTDAAPDAPWIQDR